MNKNMKRAFTITELVIVIAVVAILAAVLIPTFSNLIEKANVSNDTVLVRNLNEALIIAETTEGKPATMHDALTAVAEQGYSVEKLTPMSSGEILWEQTSNRFALIDSEGNEILKDQSTDLSNIATVWKIVEKLEGSQDCNWYVGKLSAEEISVYTFTKGVDTGSVSANVTYSQSEAEQEVIINTNGGALTINASKDIVRHYGNADMVKIEDVAPSSYHEYGQVGTLMAWKGNTVVEESASVKTLYVDAGAGATVSAEHNNVTEAFAKGGSITVGDITVEAVEEFPAVISTEEELKNAMTSGGDYVVQNDIELDETVTISSKTLNLNLNGTTLNYTATSKEGTIQIDGTSNVIISNGTIHMPNKPYYGIYVKDSSSFTLSNITADSNDGLVFGAGQETVLIENCNLTSTGYYPIYHNGSTSPATYTIRNSMINGGVYVSNAALPGRELNTLVIEGCTIFGPTAVEFKHTNATITDSILVGTDTVIGSESNNNGGCTSGYAVAVTTNGIDDYVTGTVVINNCKIYNGMIGDVENGYYFIFKVKDGHSVTIDGEMVDDYNSYDR